jgi:hypothetical protein
MSKASQTITVLTVSAFLAFAIITSPSPVLAASLQFIGTPEIIKEPNSSLIATATLKLTGMSTMGTTIFLTSSGGSAVLQCNNPSGNNPASIQVPFGSLQGPIIFLTGNNTFAVKPTLFQATVIMGPPPLPTASQVCPNPNWSIRLLSIAYNNVVLHTQQNGADILTFNFGNVDPRLNVHL